MVMLVLSGPTALSSFRVSKLRSELAAEGLGAKRIDTQFMHFVDLKEELESKCREQIQNRVDSFYS